MSGGRYDIYSKCTPSLDKKRRGGLALQEAWQLLGCLFYRVDIHITSNDSFYFYTPHSSEKDPAIQHCHSSWLDHREFISFSNAE